MTDLVSKLTKEIDHFISDVDGVMTPTSFFYNKNGKTLKQFAAHDNDGVKILKKLKIEFIAITADKRGFKISKKRMDDIGVPLLLVNENERYKFISSKFNLTKTAYIADGLFDCQLLKESRFSFAPNDATNEAINSAKIKLTRNGGCGVVYEAVTYLIKTFDKGLYKLIT